MLNTNAVVTRLNGKLNVRIVSIGATLSGVEAGRAAQWITSQGVAWQSVAIASNVPNATRRALLKALKSLQPV